MVEDAAPTALALAASALRCPVCTLGMVVDDGAVRCENGHSFDIARQGYVSFLTGNSGASTADSAEMVSARARFLGAGGYDPIAAAIVEALRSGTVPAGIALEIGGGTGFYLARLLDANAGFAGIDLDLSARALRLAARAHPRLAAIAADAWLPLPVADDAASVVLSVFSPRNPSEMSRVLSPNGRLVIVTPTPRHLSQLVSSLGLVTVDDRKPERLERQLADFELLETTAVEYELLLEPAIVRDLILMGPSARHLDPARLDDLPDENEVSVSVEVRTLAHRAT